MWEQIAENFENEGIVRWLFVFVLALVLTVIAKFILKTIESRISRFSTHTKGRIDNIVLDCLRSTKSWALFIWILTPLVRIPDGDDTQSIMKALLVVATSFQVGVWGLQVLRGWKNNYLRQRIESDASAASALNLLSTAVTGVFLIAVVLICLSNLGIDIGALVAGLGIGGIAIALAAQNILGDLFGSLSIVLDKPFVVGDYIVVGADQGTVEYIGIKTTRVRSLSGEELIFSNKDLLESRVKNFKRMRERRVVLSFSVPFDTPVDKLALIPDWIRDFIGLYEDLRFERSHLAGHGKQGASSLDFETVYWVKSPNYNKHMDIQQSLYHQVLTKLAQEKLSFALPIQVNVGYNTGVVFSNEEDEYDDLDDIAFNDRNN